MRQKTRAIFIVLALLALAVSAQALTINTDRTFYIKGDPINVTGNCKTGLETRLTAKFDEKTIFGKTLNCTAAGSYNFSYESDYLSPAGDWILTLWNSEEIITKKIKINPTSESAFYLITFLSPTEGKYKRTEDITISVRVTDAGNPIADVNVATWGPGGVKYFFENSGNGLYNLHYEIPHDARKGAWEMLVLAQSKINGRLFGGMGNLELELVNAPIAINLLEPTVHSYELTEEVPIKANVNYFNGKRIEGTPEVVAIIGGKSIALENTGGDSYEAIYEPEAGDIGSVGIVVNATDDSGNHGEKSIDLVITCSPVCLATEYGLYIIAFVVFSAIIFGIFYSRIKYFVQMSALKSEKEKTTDLVKSLQREYFGGKVMPTKSYSKNLAQYKSKISEIEEKIKRMKEEMSG